MTFLDRPPPALDADALADLVERVARDRDRAAFVALFDHFAPRLNAFLLRLGSDRGDAEDLTQDVMVTLWRKAALFDRTKSSVGTWLFRIARNRRIDRLRRDRSAETLSDPAFDPAAPDDAEAQADAQQRELHVRKALDSLSPEQRELVRLAFFRGLSHSEIAARSRLPLGTVKSRIRLAFSRLRRALEAQGIGGD